MIQNQLELTISYGYRWCAQKLKTEIENSSS